MDPRRYSPSDKDVTMSDDQSTQDEAKTPRQRAPRKAATPRKTATPRLPKADTKGKPARPQRSADQTPPATVQKHGNWFLVTYGAWQISVDPTGLLMLPRHLDPDDVDDFVGCAQVATDVGRKVRETNEAREAARVAKLGPQPPAGPRNRVIVTEGPPPEGTTRMRTVSAQQRAATIGRPKRRDPRRGPQQ